MTRERAALAERVRTLLATDAAGSTVQERSMFGAVCFMVDGAMLVAAQRDGALLVRVDPERSAELLARPGARQAEMGVGRSMGPGWLSVAAAAVADRAGLAAWLATARRDENAPDLPMQVRGDSLRGE